MSPEEAEPTPPTILELLSSKETTNFGFLSSQILEIITKRTGIGLNPDQVFNTSATVRAPTHINKDERQMRDYDEYLKKQYEKQYSSKKLAQTKDGQSYIEGSVGDINQINTYSGGGYLPEQANTMLSGRRIEHVVVHSQKGSNWSIIEIAKTIDQGPVSGVIKISKSGHGLTGESTTVTITNPPNAHEYHLKVSQGDKEIKGETKGFFKKTFVPKEKVALDLIAQAIDLSPKQAELEQIKAN